MPQVLGADGEHLAPRELTICGLTYVCTDKISLATWRVLWRLSLSATERFQGVPPGTPTHLRIKTALCKVAH